MGQDGPTKLLDDLLSLPLSPIAPRFLISQLSRFVWI